MGWLREEYERAVSRIERTPPWARVKYGKDLEQGRRLASEREDLIADGIDPAELLIPVAPENPRKNPAQRKHR